MAIQINRARTAAFDIDAQNTFTPVCPNELPVPGGDEIVDELNNQAHLASLRIGSKDAHSPKAIWVATEKEPQFSPVGAKNSDIRWNIHAVPGTIGFELVAGLPAPADYDFFVWKGIELDMHPYGACYHDLHDTLSTGVIEYLRQKGIEAVICGGLALDYCVAKTAIQLAAGGFQVIVNLGACRGIDETTVTEAIERMADAGVVLIDSASDLQEQRS